MELRLKVVKPTSLTIFKANYVADKNQPPPYTHSPNCALVQPFPTHQVEVVEPALRAPPNSPTISFRPEIHYEYPQGQIFDHIVLIHFPTDGRSGGSARTRHLIALPRYSELAAFFIIVVFVVLLGGVIIMGRRCMAEICRA